MPVHSTSNASSSTTGASPRGASGARNSSDTARTRGESARGSDAQTSRSTTGARAATPGAGGVSPRSDAYRSHQRFENPALTEAHRQAAATRIAAVARGDVIPEPGRSEARTAGSAGMTPVVPSTGERPTEVSEPSAPVSPGSDAYRHHDSFDNPALTEAHRQAAADRVAAVEKGTVVPLFEPTGQADRFISSPD